MLESCRLFCEQLLKDKNSYSKRYIISKKENSMTVGELWRELMNLNSEKARFAMMNLFGVTQNELTQFLSENKDTKIILEKK